MSENLGEVDLFGDPVRLPNGRRGRPAHTFSQKIENKIKLLLALGWSFERIAKACHISVPTMRRYYFSALKAREAQRDRLVAWQFEKLFEMASSGNVGALKELQRMIERNDQMLAADRLAKVADKDDHKEKVGKKELARRAALEAARDGQSGWGDLLKPQERFDA